MKAEQWIALWLIVGLPIVNDRNGLVIARGAVEIVLTQHHQLCSDTSTKDLNKQTNCGMLPG